MTKAGSLTAPKQSTKLSSQVILDLLQTQFPTIKFSPGKRFSWSPAKQTVIYDPSRQDKTAAWSLLHETGHALLTHQTYQADFELLQMEMAAWARAKELTAQLGLPEIAEDHIQDCLDTYRDWLHKRSVCPSCGTQGLQQADFKHYQCHNCHSTWQVTPSRFTRAYRRRAGRVSLPEFS